MQLNRLQYATHFIQETLFQSLKTIARKKIQPLVNYKVVVVALSIIVCLGYLVYRLYHFQGQKKITLDQIEQKQKDHKISDHFKQNITPVQNQEEKLIGEELVEERSIEKKTYR